MPNWCDNTLTFDCDDTTFKRIFDEITTKTVNPDNGKSSVLLDFNKIIPMPPSLEKMPSGSQTQNYIELYLINLNKTDKNAFTTTISQLAKTDEGSRTDKLAATHINHYLKMTPDEQTAYEAELYKKVSQPMLGDNNPFDIGQLAIENLINYGHYDWYGWRIDNWDTKWNACDLVTVDDVHELCFSTAWSPCIKVIKTLAAKYPDVPFRYIYDEMGMQFAGAIKYDGKGALSMIEVSGHDAMLYHAGINDIELRYTNDGNIIGEEEFFDEHFDDMSEDELNQAWDAMDIANTVIDPFKVWPDAVFTESVDTETSARKSLPIMES